MTADHWAVTQLTEMDYHAKTVRIWVLCWASAEAKAAGKEYIPEGTKDYYMNEEEFNEWMSDEALAKKGNTPLSQAYKFIKQKEDFFGDAEDM